jgi:hypothetical protein
MDQWTTDPTFRERMRADPEGTVRQSGVELDRDEWEALRSTDWTLSDEELQTRANKDA